MVDTTVPTKKKGKLRWRKKNSKTNQNENGSLVIPSKQKKIQKLAAKKKERKNQEN